MHHRIWKMIYFLNRFAGRPNWNWCAFISACREIRNQIIQTFIIMTIQRFQRLHVSESCASTRLSEFAKLHSVKIMEIVDLLLNYYFYGKIDHWRLQWECRKLADIRDCAQRQRVKPRYGLWSAGKRISLLTIHAHGWLTMVGNSFSSLS